MFKMELTKYYANLILQLKTLGITQDKNMLIWGMPFCIILLLLTVYIIRKRKLQYLSKCLEKTRLSLQTDDSSGRFRKRDKVLFYGRKMLRKVKIISGHVRGGQGKKRKLVLKLARKLLRMKDNLRPRLKTMEPPEEYLREDVYSKEDQRVPPDAFYMLQSIRIFGHFERPIFLKLCKYTELINVPAGSYLFKIGDPDEDVYIVQSGKLTVFATNDQGVVISLKVVNTGESLISLLSFTDVLTGHQRPFKTVCARALEHSVVVKLPVKAFQQVFEEYPDTFIRVMQVIMVRLQRVTFTALHQYLGLATELVNQVLQKKNPVLHRSKELVSNEPSYYGTVDSGDIDGSLHQPELADLPNLLPNIVNAHKCNQSSIHHRRTRSAVETKNHSDFLSHIDIGGPVVNTIISNDGSNIHYVRKRSTVADHSVSKTELIQMATETFIRELGLMDDSLVKGKIEAWEITAGTYIMQEDSHQGAALACLMTGALSVHQRNAGDDETEEEVYLYTVYPGEIVGGLSVLTAELSFHSIKAKQTSWIALLSKDSVYTMLRERPQTVLHIADTVVRRLSPFVRQVDFALDWQFIDSGRAVYRQDDESDSTYIVLSGRLRSVITHEDGKKELVAEYGKGDLVGIVEMVTHTRRSTTVMAIRDSELAKLPEGLFNAIKLRYPIVVTRLINLLGHRILGSWKKPGVTGKVEITRGQGNLSTVAVVAISDDVPITCFTYELFNSLSMIGSTLRLTSEIVKKALGQSIMDASNEYRLTSWLAQQEDQYRITVYQCDQTMTEWTQRCVRQADCILIVALGSNSPNVTTIEKQVGKLAIRTQKELVLLHQEETVLPQDTVAWLNMRTWISHHHHIKCVKHVFTTKSQYRINKLYNNKEGTQQTVNIHSDFSRLARWLTGTSVGLVLGGGGARGAAHIGMMKAIQEVGIPIDMVGGVSIGAFMGGLWCIHRNTALMTQKARDWSKKMTHWWRQLWDLTYPVTSMFTGTHFNNTIRSTFDQIQIEDLWIPYFAITTDISASGMRVHTDGCLWQYVRASMSLSGYMPPLCDPRDGHLLLDGGYVNNLPADVMHSRGAKYILAVDVGSQDETDLTNYGDSLSGWWLLWKRYNPFTSPVKVPILPDIQSRLAYVSCVRQLEEVKNSDYCEYIRPPIDVFRTLQFSSFDEIREVGYNHGKLYLTGLLKSGSLTWSKGDSLRSSKHSINKASNRYSYTFTDLAQMVCKVQPQTYIDESSSSSSGSEYEMDEDAHEGGYASEPSSNILQMNRTRKVFNCTHSLSENEMEYDDSSLATYA